MLYIAKYAGRKCENNKNLESDGLLETRSDIAVKLLSAVHSPYHCKTMQHESADVTTINKNT